MVICRFFQQGRCNQGDKCRFEHPNPPLSTETRDEASASICAFFRRGTCRFGDGCKQSHDLDNCASIPDSTTIDTRSKIVCTFFLRNSCSKGSTCPFIHPTETSSTLLESTQGGAEAIDVYGRQYQTESSSEVPKLLEHFSSNERDIAGATIMFAEGAAIAKIALPADFSMILISNIAAAASHEDIRNVLETWLSGEDIKMGAWKIDPQTLMKSVEVKVADGGRLCKSKFSQRPKLRVCGSELQLNPIYLGSGEAGTNRLQLAAVTCTWHNPSKTATISYGNSDRATRAMSSLSKQNRDLRGRRLTFEHAQQKATTAYHKFNSARAREMEHIIRIGNLDVETSEAELRQYLRHHIPKSIRFGSTSHLSSSSFMEQRIKRSLQKYGNILDWVVSPQPGTATVKGYAKFTDYLEAAQAAKELEGSRVDSQSKDVLHVQHVISVKLPVSQRVLTAIKPQLDKLAQTSQSISCVTVKAYDNPAKTYTQVRVSGSEKKPVAQVKDQVEELLAGNIIQDETQPLTHPYFFQSTASPFLDEVMRTCRVVILHDRCKTLLRMYGDTECVKAAQKALQMKAADIENQTKDIILDPETLATAMRGGLQGIIAALGKGKAKLDITSSPKRIIVSGSDDDAKLAEHILYNAHANLNETIATLTINDDEDSLCAVCWTPAEDPVTTICDHTYCKGCLESQATSTAEFPMCCLGNSGKCNTPFALPELRRMLAPGPFDGLLESALNNHIRSHPKDFAYCSTPDCNRFYRTSGEDTAVVFDCDHCLASICTACHNAAHEVESCTQAKAGRDGSDDFAEWKKNNDVRDCPSCATPIQKSEGCNHMECRSCKAHICWHCMRVFDRGPDVYDHMNKDHKGDWGLGWLRQDFE